MLFEFTKQNLWFRVMLSYTGMGERHAVDTCKHGTKL
jgi:hypothetical protein